MERAAHWKRGRLGVVSLAVVLLGPGLLFFIGWGVLHVVASGICSSYNFISNDLCDRWHYEPPPEEALPLAEDWSVRWSHLSCGSGGCPTRVYVIEPAYATMDPIRAYVRLLGRQRWAATEAREGAHPFFVFEKDGVRVTVSSAADALGRAPQRLTHRRYVQVHVSLIDEAATDP